VAGLLFILSAPSGSGKSTLVGELRSMVSDLDFSVSWTTRAPRGSEQDGREYHFTTQENFRRMIDADEFLEHALVFGNYYGTARQSLRGAAARGRDLLLDIDVQGASQVRQKMPEAVSIFILPPKPEILALRLNNRSRAEGGVPREVVEERLATARQEIENYRQYRYVLVNDVLDRAVAELSAIVLAERSFSPAGVMPDAAADRETERVRNLACQCRLENSFERLKPVLASFGISM
jgi:guanylate kinase